jgi:hypothetical protein
MTERAPWDIAPSSAALPAAKVLFAGMPAEVIYKILGEEAARFEITQTKGTADTLALVISNAFQHVVVDITHGNDALALLVPLLASSDHDFKLMVVSRADDASKFLRMRGVDRVLKTPLVQQQLRVALGVREERAAPEKAAVKASVPEPQAPIAEQRPVQASGLQMLRNRAVSLVSSFYKNAAFVLLAILFSAFCFYAVLIGFFLLSTTWGAPVTLSKGHDLVAKSEQQINDMRVNLNLTNQRYSEAQLEAAQATRAHADARLLVGYVLGTVEKEIESRTAHKGTLAATLKRTLLLKSAFEKSLGAAGIPTHLEELYAKRLIDKSTMQSQIVSALEASQRLAGLEGDLANTEDELRNAESNISMLKSLAAQLRGGPQAEIQAASSDLILLTKQAVDARTAFDQSKVQLASANARLDLLNSNKTMLAARIAELLASPIGRATEARVDVIFVPYGNERNFKPGAPLYTCSLTIFWCRLAGHVGAAVPGESNTVHPFFGKPIRGFFVEAKLDDTTAASEEIIHVGRPPFYF